MGGGKPSISYCQSRPTGYHSYMLHNKNGMLFVDHVYIMLINAVLWLQERLRSYAWNTR